MDKQIRAKKEWINLYLETKDARYVCRRYGISRSTLRKWYRCYLQKGEKGGKKPRLSSNQKINDQHENWIMDLHHHGNLGARRIQRELIRLHQYHLSLASIHKVLIKKQAKPVKKP